MLTRTPNAETLQDVYSSCGRMGWELVLAFVFVGFGFGSAELATAHVTNGIVVDSQGDIFFIEIYQPGTSRLWRLTDEKTLEWMHPTQADGSELTLVDTHKLAIDQDDNLYVGASAKMWKITPQMNASVVCDFTIFVSRGEKNQRARISYLSPIAVDQDGGLYVVCSYSAYKPGFHIIRIVEGEATWVAHVETDFWATGSIWSSSFAINSQREIYVSFAKKIFACRASDHESRVLAGNDDKGFKDGSATESRFAVLTGLDVNSDGNIIAADLLNWRVRSIDTKGNVVTLAGNGKEAIVDGIAAEASFSHPTGIAIGKNGVIYIKDHDRPGWNPVIRKLDAKGVVTTIADYDGIKNASAFDLRKFALTYKRHLDQTKKGPTNWAEAIKTAGQIDCVASLKRLEKLNLHVVWGQSTADATVGDASFILAYERSVDLRGGYVALLDGNVKNFSAAEIVKMLEAQSTAR